MLFFFTSFLLCLTLISPQMVSLSPLFFLSLSSFIIALWFLMNSGHLLIALLLLEGTIAAMLPMVVFYMSLYKLSSIIIFLFVVIVVCESCMGLACLLNSIRIKSNELSNSSFFTN